MPKISNAIIICILITAAARITSNCAQCHQEMLQKWHADSCSNKKSVQSDVDWNICDVAVLRFALSWLQCIKTGQCIETTFDALKIVLILVLSCYYTYNGMIIFAASLNTIAFSSEGFKIYYFETILAIVALLVVLAHLVENSQSLNSARLRHTARNLQGKWNK